jgi:hypothetical protein
MFQEIADFEENNGIYIKNIQKHCQESVFGTAWKYLAEGKYEELINQIKNLFTQLNVRKEPYYEERFDNILDLLVQIIYTKNENQFRMKIGLIVRYFYNLTSHQIIVKKNEKNESIQYEPEEKYNTLEVQEKLNEHKTQLRAIFYEKHISEIVKYKDWNSIDYLPEYKIKGFGYIYEDIVINSSFGQAWKMFRQYKFEECLQILKKYLDDKPDKYYCIMIEEITKNIDCILNLDITIEQKFKTTTSCLKHAFSVIIDSFYKMIVYHQWILLNESKVIEKIKKIDSFLKTFDVNDPRIDKKKYKYYMESTINRIRNYKENISNEACMSSWTYSMDRFISDVGLDIYTGVMSVDYVITSLQEMVS